MGLLRYGIILALIVLLFVVSGSQQSTLAQIGNPLDKIAPWVIEHTANGTQAEFLVVLTEQADLSGAYTLVTRTEKAHYVRDALWNKAQTTQGPLRAWLVAHNIEHRSYYIVNLLWVKGDRDVALALAARPDVARIEGNPQIRNVLPRPLEVSPELEPPDAPQAVEPNIAYVHAPEVWAMGFTGQGIVVGGQDTGYYWQHPALQPHYRGWNGITATHDYNWHDSIHSGGGSCGANSTQPCDDYGHGTHTMGTAVGSDGGANQIGMAPGAEWIGCRNMDQGVGQPSTYLECFEFFLAPYPVGGTPAQGDPSQAPDVTNNSWGCPTSEGCSWNTLQAAVEAQRAAGIMTVVSAGNDGPNCSTVQDPPAIYAASYSVGALNTGTDSIASFSSRGPVTVDGSNRRKPDITAPGTTIRSSVPGGGYQSAGWSGTSMAGPHVAGAVALLWSARPALMNQITLTEQTLNNSAFHISSTACSSSGWPNNTFGYGRLDVKAAVDSVPLDSGTLRGVISDAATSTPIVGALVQATASPTQTGSTVSGAGGLYALSLLTGTYTVTASAPGYMTYITTGMRVLTSQTTTLNLSLQITPTFAVFGYVQDAFTNEPLSATVRVPGSSIVPAQTDPATGWYSLTVPMGTHTLRAEAVHHVSSSRAITVTGNRQEDFALQPVCLLVVDDDGGANYQSYYTNALDRLGTSYEAVTSGPGLTTLADYAGVIWLTGDLGSNTLTAADQSNLAAYLDGGGRVFLSGQDMGFDIGGTDFYRSYLRAAFVSDNANATTLTGLDFMAGQDITIQGGDGANNQLYPDEVTSLDGGVAVFKYPSPHKDGGVAYSGIYRSVYLSFGYEGINSQAQRDQVMSRTLAYLGACGTPQAPQAGFTSSAPAFVGQPVVFTNTTQGTAWMTYTWDWGDHTPLNYVVHPMHIYTQPGVFTVVLTATSRYGHSVYSDTVVVAANCELIGGLGLSFEPQQPWVGQSVTLTGSVKAGTLPITYTWDLGDGSIGSGPVVTHVFPLAAVVRTYTVTLTAANTCPSQQSVTDAVTVQPFAVYLPLIVK